MSVLVITKEANHHYHKLVLVRSFDGDQVGAVVVLAEEIRLVPGEGGIALKEKASHSHESSIGPTPWTGAPAFRCWVRSMGWNDQH